jgi:hypothetical protein
VTAILCGKLRVEVISDTGARVQRVGFSQAAADLLHFSQAGTVRSTPTDHDDVASGVSGRGGHPAWAGRMFWLKRNRLPGS